MANRKRDPGKEKFWRRVLKLFEESGLSVRAFCQQHDLAEPSFYARRSSIAQRDQQQSTPAADPTPTEPDAADGAVPLFLPLRLQAQAEPIDVILPDGTLIRVPPAFDADALQRLHALLRGPSC